MITRMIDKASVTLLTAAIVCANETEIHAAAIVLVTFSISMLTLCLDKQKLTLIALGGYIFICFFEPHFCCGLPIIAYDLIRLKNLPLSIAMIIVMLYSFPLIGSITVLLCFVGIIVSAMTELKTERLEIARRELIEIRDNSKELNISLAEKNQELVRLRDYEVYTATLKERNRIAREIHDNVGHLLTRCLLQMGALIVVTKDERQRENLEGVQSSINGAMTSIRQSVHDLHDDSIDMEQTIRDLMRTLPERFSVALDYGCSEDIKIEIKLAFIGIIKEALNNTSRHSSGDRVYITLQEYSTFYRLIVMDNGKNPTVENPTYESGIGLENMRSRAQSLGGKLRIYSSEKGFKVFVTIEKE